MPRPSRDTKSRFRRTPRPARRVRPRLPPKSRCRSGLPAPTLGRGEASAKKCASCHTFGKGEPNRVGPNLFGVVGRQKASEAGFNYSAAMKGQKGNWTPEDLDTYLTNPKGYGSRHHHELRRHSARQGAGRPDRLPQRQSDKPVDLPKQAAEAPKAQ